MKTTFICLANSQKLGGRCVAGIEITGSKPVIINNHPNWIRPISNSEHGELPYNLVSHIKLLDIVEIDVTKHVPNGYQSENVLFDLSSIKVVGKFPLDELHALCNTSSSNIFGNKGKAVNEDVIDTLPDSLMLVYADDFEIYKSESSHPRIKFNYNGNFYDLPITDNGFQEAFNADNSFFDKDEAYLIISLALVHNGWHSKLIAGVI